MINAWGFNKRKDFLEWLSSCLDILALERSFFSKCRSAVRLLFLYKAFFSRISLVDKGKVYFASSCYDALQKLPTFSSHLPVTPQLMLEPLPSQPFFLLLILDLKITTLPPPTSIPFQLIRSICLLAALNFLCTGGAGTIFNTSSNLSE
jgi:hypothetical protein